MKTPSALELKPRHLASLFLAATLATANAATLTPIAVGDTDVTAAIAGRINFALASGGGAGFSSSDLGPAYASDRVNDGVIDHSGNSWIAASTTANEFVAVKFAAASVVGAVVWSGQTGYNSRSGADYTLEYTKDASPAAGSTWTAIGTYTYVEVGCGTPMPRTCFAFTPISGATAVRLLLGSATCGQQLCVQELEAYGPVSLTPGSVGDAAVAGAIAGRPNVALASAGGVAFSSSDLGPAYAWDRVNDGVIDQTGNSWIAATAAGGDFVGVAFAVPASIDSVVWHGETGYDGRSGADYSLEYTWDTTPGAASSWVSLGSYTYVETGCALPMPRSFFSFPLVTNVTGVRLVITGLACGVEPAIQELEAYGPLVNPPNITTPPIGGTYPEGSMLTLTVLAEGGSAFQWKKDGVDIPDATGSSYTILNLSTNDAGSYTVKVINSAGDVTSDPSVLVVTPGQVFATYSDAVLTDSPIHYYPMDDTTGTTAADLGSLATTGGTYAGGFTLGQFAATTRLGKAVRFNGTAGTWVDLGLFHPGNSVTLEAWVNLDPTAAANYNAILARWDGSYEIDVNPSSTPNLVIRNQNNDIGIAAFPTPLTRGQWYHFVGVFANGQLTVWINGVSGPSVPLAGTLRDGGPTPDRVLIGATREGVLQWKGSIDEVAIYDTGLSAAQIRAHYRAAMPPTPPALTIQSAVLLSWPTFPTYQLQSAPHVDGPYTNETRIPFVEDNLNKLADPLGLTQKYYRLIQP